MSGGHYDEKDEKVEPSPYDTAILDLNIQLIEDGPTGSGQFGNRRYVKVRDLIEAAVEHVMGMHVPGFCGPMPDEFYEFWRQAIENLARKEKP